jgi:septal ring factor EnvC (AmiA/AmiB activator)
VIATVGDTGGNARSGLYVEIRKGRQALDPLAWLRKS